MRMLAGVVASIALLCGCAGDARLENNPANQVQVVEALPPAPSGEAARIAQSEPYVIGPLDLLAVRVLGYDEFDSEVQVDSGGRIQVPLIGSAQAAGKSPEQLSEELTVLMARDSYLKKPRVAVQVKEIKSRYVSVDGAVRTPGIYQLPGKVRLTGALALAQGVNEFAAMDNVAVFREIDGQQYAAIFNMRDMRRGLYAEPEIYAGDTIVVGESGVRRAFRNIIQIAPFFAVFRPFG